MQFFQKITLVVLGLFVSATAWADFSWNFPEPVTPMALDTLHVHNKFMLIIIVVFLAVLGIMVYSIIKHRKDKGFQPVADKAPSTAIDIIWTLVPFAILLLIDYVIMGIPAYHSVVMMEDTRNKADMVIKVTGSQWRWQYEYLDGPAEGVKFLSSLATPTDQQAKGYDGEFNENYLLEVDNRLVLPVGQKVRIIMTASDVLHNWWVPQFGSARLAIPGFINETWVQVEKEGTYRGQCKELCGKGHGYMPVVVDAVPQAQYDAWAAEKKAEIAKAAASADKEWTMDELMAEGKAVYEKQCAACHMPTGAGLPPAFPALTGSAITTSPIFGDDGKYLPDSHLDRVLNGKGVMPAWKDMLNDAEIAAVITYERNGLGNSVGDMLQPAQVKAAR